MSRKISLILSFLLIAVVFPTNNNIVIKAETQNLSEKGIQGVIPQPKKVENKKKDIIIGNRINIITDDSVDEDVKLSLKEGLKTKDIVWNQPLKDSVYTIYLVYKNGETELIKSKVSNTSLIDITSKGSEAYQFISTNRYTIINGSDDRGLFYGVKTLVQLLQQDTIESLNIIDYPDMRVRGTVEGFYGSPWTTEERVDQFKFYGNMKLNTYIYAPKDDPYHRLKWREPYPEEELERMTTLIESAKRNKVDFVFAISPGIDIDLTGPEKDKDFQALMNKAETLYKIGVRSFAIYFDDIENKDGVNQAKLLNRFQEEFVNKQDNVEPLITVPTEYDTFAMIGHGPVSTYTKDFSSTLKDDIHVMWTGSVVVSEKLTRENAEFVHDIFGDNIAIWWNYPVTDYQKEKLALGPIVDIDNDIDDLVDYFFMNPMEHAHLSKIALGTGADFSWNMKNYNETQSWYNVLSYLYGDLAFDMKIFAEHSTRMNKAWDVGRLEAPEIQEDILNYWKSIGSENNIVENAGKLENHFNKMILSSEKLLKELPQHILGESKSNIQKLGVLGKVGIDALNMNLAENSGDIEKAKSLKNSIKTSGYNSGRNLSEKVVVAFIEEALNFNPMPVVDFDITNNFVAPNEIITLYNKSSLITRDVRWEIPGATIIEDNKDSLTIKFNNEGRYTVKLFGENSKGKDELILENYITVSNLAKLESKNLALDKPTTVSSACATNEAGKYAVDGNVDSKWCANSGWNHFIIIDLGEQSLLKSIDIFHAEAGGEPKASNTRDFTIQLGEDLESLTTVVDVKNNTSGITKHPIKAQHARFIKLNITKPTQGGDRAARIFEISVNGIEGSHELPNIYSEINFEELNKLVDHVNALNALDYTDSSWNKIVTILKEAEAMLGKTNVEQKEVDEMVLNLERAKNELIEKADKSKLMSLITEISTYNAIDYSNYTWNNLIENTNIAKQTLADNDAIQTEVDELARILEESINNLVMIKELKNIIESMEQISLENYTEASSDVLKEALNNAQTALEDDQIDRQQVEEQINSIKTAFDALIQKEDLQVNFDSLIKQVEKFDTLDEQNYTTESFEQLRTLVTEAKALLANPQTSQIEVDRQVREISSAFENLSLKPNLDEINALISKYEKLSQKDYTASSWSIFTEQLNIIKAEIELGINSELLALEKLNELKEIEKVLEVKENINKEPLSKFVAQLRNINLDLYLEESYENLLSLLEQADTLLTSESVTQKELDDLHDKLEVAFSELIKIVDSPSDGKEDIMQDNSNIESPDQIKPENKPHELKPKDKDSLPSTGQGLNSIGVIGSMITCMGVMTIILKKRK